MDGAELHDQVFGSFDGVDRLVWRAGRGDLADHRLFDIAEDGRSDVLVAGKAPGRAVRPGRADPCRVRTSRRGLCRRLRRQAEIRPVRRRRRAQAVRSGRSLHPHRHGLRDRDLRARRCAALPAGPRRRRLPADAELGRGPGQGDSRSRTSRLSGPGSSPTSTRAIRSTSCSPAMRCTSFPTSGRPWHWRAWRR